MTSWYSVHSLLSENVSLCSAPLIAGHPRPCGGNLSCFIWSLSQTVLPSVTRGERMETVNFQISGVHTLPAGGGTQRSGAESAQQTVKKSPPAAEASWKHARLLSCFRFFLYCNQQVPSDWMVDESTLRENLELQSLRSKRLKRLKPISPLALTLRPPLPFWAFTFKCRVLDSCRDRGLQGDVLGPKGSWI